MEQDGGKWGIIPKMILTGTYHHSIDEKNRLFLPAKLRKGISRFIITPGLENCLNVYPMHIWIKLVNKFETIGMKDKSKERIFKRIFLSNAAEIEVDEQGRIVIPQLLKTQIKIKRDVVVIGVSNRLEIWSKEKWNSYYKKARKVFEKLANKLEI